MSSQSKSFKYIYNSFHRNVEMIHQERIPQQGPVLFYMNHSQFMFDAHCFTLLKKTKVVIALSRVMYQKPFFKYYNAFNIDPITVQRPLDVAYQIKGHLIKIQGNKIIGKDTDFTKLKPLQSILLKTADQFLIQEIINKQQLIIKNPKNLKFQNISEFKIIPIMDFSQFFNDVIKRFANRENVAVSNEGRSHDCQQLMPMKAGLANIAFGLWKRHKIKLKFQPIVAHTHKQHLYRSQYFYEFGHPFQLTDEIISLFQKKPKKAINIMSNLLWQNVQHFKPELIGQTTQDKAINLRRLSYIANNDFKPHQRSQKLVATKRMADLANRILKNKEKYPQTYQRFENFNKILVQNQLDVLELNRNNYENINFIKLCYYSIKILLKLILTLPGIILYGPSALIAKILSNKKHIQYSLEREWAAVPGKQTDMIGSYKTMYFCLFSPFNTLVNLVAGYKCLQACKFKSNQSFKILGGATLLLPIYHELFKFAYDEMGKDYKDLRHIFIKMFNKKLVQEVKLKQDKLMEKIRPSL